MKEETPEDHGWTTSSTRNATFTHLMPDHFTRQQTNRDVIGLYKLGVSLTSVTPRRFPIDK